MEKILVWLIVAAAALYVGRRLLALFSGKAKGCGCDSDCRCCEDDCDRKGDG
ncbi:MAG: FeoB-associated Cys-rich membrane protein [Thermodesulfobacteriota bacterium]